MKVCPSCQAGTLGDAPECAECASELTAVPIRSGTNLDGMVIAGKYTLDEFVGEGAMGWVYRGTHRILDRAVAIKLLKPSPVPNPTRDARFAREARTASRLNHPHIILVIEFGKTPGGFLYIVTEYLRGQTLADRLTATGCPPLRWTAAIFSQILAALDEAHTFNLVHRDIKPENIMILPMHSGDEFVKVLDFGVARVLDDPGKRLTQQGQIFGTPAYMSPEQAAGREASHLSDLYASTLILYEMLVGRGPFQAKSAFEMLTMQLQATPLPLRQAAPDLGFSAELEAVLERGLAKDPAARFPSTSDLRDALFATPDLRAPSVLPCDACHHRGRFPWSGACTSCVHVDSAPDSVSRARRFDESAGTVDSVTQSVEKVVAVAQTGPTPNQRREIFGRSEETDLLRSFLSSEDSILEIIGPTGVGKSSYLTIANRLATEMGFATVTAGRDPSLACAPWHPIRTLVSEVLGLEPGSMEPESLGGMVLQAGLVPEDILGIADLFGMSSNVEQGPGASRLQELRAAAIRALLRANTTDQPRCFLLDDSDEFDGPSMALLRQICDQAPLGKTKIVMTGERGILKGGSNRDQIRLRGLESHPIEQLAASLGFHSLPVGLQAISKGNPLHVIQALRLLMEGGTPEQQSAHELIAARLETLGQDARDLLEALCVLGDEFPLDVANQIATETTEGEALSILVDRALLEVTEGRVAVTHSLVGHVARQLTPSDRRSPHHRMALAVLDKSNASIFARARHAAMASLGETSLNLLEQAGDAAARHHDDEGAAGHYRNALHIARWELLISGDDERFLGISRKLGDALRTSGHRLAAGMVYKEALSANGKHPEVRARLLLGQARLLRVGTDTELALGLLKRAAEQAMEAKSDALLAEITSEISEVLVELDRAGQAVAELEEAVWLLTNGRGPSSQRAPVGFWSLLERLGQLRLDDNNIDRAVDLGFHALRHAEAEGTRTGIARCHLFLAAALDHAKRPSETEEHCAAALSSLRELGIRREVGECLLQRASSHPARHAALVDEALELFRQIGWTKGIEAAERLMKSPAS